MYWETNYNFLNFYAVRYSWVWIAPLAAVQSNTKNALVLHRLYSPLKAKAQQRQCVGTANTQKLSGRGVEFFLVDRMNYTYWSTAIELITRERDILPCDDKEKKNMEKLKEKRKKHAHVTIWPNYQVIVNVIIAFRLHIFCDCCCCCCWHLAGAVNASYKIDY